MGVGLGDGAWVETSVLLAPEGANSGAGRELMTADRMKIQHGVSQNLLLRQDRGSAAAFAVHDDSVYVGRLYRLHVA